MARKTRKGILDAAEKMEVGGQERLDRWANTTTGAGVGSKMAGTSFYSGATLGFDEVEKLYRSDWVARKIVETPVFDMLREGIDWQEADTKGLDKLEEWWETLDWSGLMYAGFIEAFKHGGALAVFTFDDNAELREPLNPGAVRGIKRVDIVPRWQASGVAWYTDFEHPRRGEIEHYNVTFQYAALATSLPVHESRVIRFDAPYSSPITKAKNNGWNDGRLQHTYEALKNFGVAVESGSETLQDFVFKWLRTPGLRDKMADGKWNALFNRMVMMANKITSSKTVLIDEAEEINKTGTPVTGLDQLMIRYEEYVCAASNVPRSRMVGGQSGNLGGNSMDGDTLNYYDWVKGLQTALVSPIIKRFIEFVSYIEGYVPKELKFDFRPLWQLSELEQADLRLKMMQHDIGYIGAQVVFPEEVAASRFGGDEPDYTSMHLDTGDRKAMREAEEVTPEDAENIISEGEE